MYKMPRCPCGEAVPSAEHGWNQRAGHNSVAFTLTRYGGLFEDGSEAADDRLDALLGSVSKTPGNSPPLHAVDINESKNGAKD